MKDGLLFKKIMKIKSLNKRKIYFFIIKCYIKKKLFLLIYKYFYYINESLFNYHI